MSVELRAEHAPRRDMTTAQAGGPAGGYVLFADTATDERRPRWLTFDDVWYAARYDVAEPRAFYRAVGARLRRSPSRFFDEAWYVARYPDVLAGIEAGVYTCGFEHYCAGGYHDRSPNYLFDEAYYRKSNPDLFRAGGSIDAHGYANGYDHYLSDGAFEGRQPSRFFDDAVWRMFREHEFDVDEESAAPIMQYLATVETVPGDQQLARTSWYFDPSWYLTRYPAVAAAIRAGEWSCPLAHYVGNRTASQFDPNPHFSENYYAKAHPDVASAVAAGIYRNCYAHFLATGAAEQRAPMPEINLMEIADARVKAEIDGGLYPDVFAYYIASRQETNLRSNRDRLPPSELQAKLLFAENARTIASVAGRHPLDFAVPDGKAPAASVIMVLHNQISFSIAALASLHAQRLEVELILVDSGSTDETTRIERYVRGARILRFPTNVNFVEGCNAALEHATADAILYLNNDLLLAPRALELALKRLASRADAAAVGARIVRAHGKLQEAGCILWRGGHTTGYLRDRSPDAPEANFVREVDFCSAAFLLVRASLAHALGGFDSAFKPAYYEDTDFCIRLRKSGNVVLYDPDVVVYHYEYGSSNSVQAAKLIEKSQALLCRRHGDFLRAQYNYRGTEYVKARSSRRGQRRILLIEDRLPQRLLGSGYVRSNDIVRSMAELDYAVTIFPVRAERAMPPSVRCEFPDTVEVMHDRSAASLAAFITERSGMYDLVWIGRTHNLQLLLPLLAAASGDLPDFGMILDTEAVVAPRTFAMCDVLGQDNTNGMSLIEALEHELACARFCQKIVAVNERDAEYIKLCGHEAVDVLGHVAVARPTSRGFQDRGGLLFVGALHAKEGPNFDSLDWFATEVLPLIVESLGEGVRLTIAGYVAAGIDMARFAADPHIEVLGEVDDLTPLYDRARVFVAPTRFAGGIPFKVHEAASFGLPVVATSLLCRQLDWTDRIEIVDGGDNNAMQFARRVVDLYQDAELWERVRDTALERINVDNSAESFRSRLARILSETLVCGRLAH